jgi:peptidoglycan L-alanyl-D-glutamate endopeptidase CwlK
VVDGDFGNKTLQSVIAFQKSKKLTADGVVGSKTWSELKKNSKLETPIFDLTKWKLTPEFERKAFQFLVIAKADGYNLKITSGRRTQAEQNALYEQGRTTQGAIVTWTRNSKHISGLAFDVAFVGATPYPNNFDWEILGKIGERIGLKWGGRFSTPDRPHFEL